MAIFQNAKEMQNSNFCGTSFFKRRTSECKFSLKICFCRAFFCLAGCKFFYSKSDASEKFPFRIWRVLKILIQSLIFTWLFCRFWLNGQCFVSVLLPNKNNNKTWRDLISRVFGCVCFWIAGFRHGFLKLKKKTFLSTRVNDFARPKILHDFVWSAKNGKSRKILPQRFFKYQTIYLNHLENFLQFIRCLFKFSLLNLFNSFCTDWSTGLRSFCLLVRAR